MGDMNQYEPWGTVQDACKKVRKEHAILWDLPQNKFRALVKKCLRQLIDIKKIRYHKPGSGIDY